MLLKKKTLQKKLSDYLRYVLYIYVIWLFQAITNAALEIKTQPSLFTSFCQQTTAHGFAYVGQSSNSRIFWIIFIMIAFATNTVHLLSLAMQYTSYPSLQNVYHTNQPPTFPSVTVCNKDPINSRFIIPDDIMELQGRYEFSLVDLLYARFDQLERQRLGHNFSDFIIGCWINEKGIYRNCSDYTTITLFQTSTYFNCYTIKGGFEIRNKLTSAQMTLLLYFDKHESVMYYEETGLYYVDARKTRERGAMIEIHTPNTIPNPRVRATDITPGYSTNLELKQNKIIKLGPPFSLCSNKEYLHNLEAYSYSSDGCRDLCVAQHIGNVCNCTSRKWPLFGMTQAPCLNISRLLGNVISIDVENQPIAPLESCELRDYIDTFDPDKCNCIEKCEYNKYSFIKSERKWLQRSNVFDTYGVFHNTLFMTGPSIAYEEMFHKNLILDYSDEDMDAFIQENFARVEIFFETFGVEVLEEKRMMTLTDLFSGIFTALFNRFILTLMFLYG